MKALETDPIAELRENAEQHKSLTSVLAKSEHVGTLVKESAEELSTVNADIKQELANQGSLPGVENALQKSEAVEDKVHEASDKLSVVNQALKSEVKKRHVLESNLAAVKEQGEADRHAAFHDVLTGLPNRALFYDRLEQGFEQARRHGWALAVMFFDVDDFKIVNDTYGHSTGDKVLQGIAARLKKITRGEDTVSRYGGDEFVILINEVREETNISLVAEKILAETQAPCDIRARGLPISVSIKASIGISIYPKDGSSAAALVDSADKAMYVAKENKSRYSFAP
jgi:diguanylate cyclase (GGDEF)-like protein